MKQDCVMSRTPVKKTKSSDVYRSTFAFEQKIKRQIEIISLCINKEPSDLLTVEDLAEKFNVEGVTIKRDLKDLRELAINIHSVARKGIRLDQEPSDLLLKQLILHYTAMHYSEQTVDRATTLLITAAGKKSLKHVTLLQQCIDNSVEAKIRYRKNDAAENDYVVQPLLIFQNDSSWRLLTQSRKNFLQFHISQILSVEPCTEKFKKPDIDSLLGLHNNAWKSWIGGELQTIRLRIYGKWVDRIKSKVLIPNQKIKKEPDGSLLFEAKVNNLKEVAAWIVARGDGITVLEPEALKETVIRLAQETLKNYYLTTK